MLNRFSARRCLACLSALLASPAFGQLIVTEVLYDPASNEDRWEWIEVRNAGIAAVDLDGYVIDRVGDPERMNIAPNITSRPLIGVRTVANPTVLPAGGIAVLYNGPALGYDPGRFRAAWPQTSPGTTLIGVEGWSSNQLTNSPKPSDYAPSLPAMTVGFWVDEAAYRLDAADFGVPGSPDRRVFRTDHAATAFGYDDNPPWRDTLGRSSIHYLGGPVFDPASWGRSNAPYGGTSESVKTHQPAPVNAADFGSPGVAPAGTPASPGLMITEIMANPASVTGATNEWEWIELHNTGPTIDFSITPYWLDDDDTPGLEQPNLTTGRIETGATAVLFNATAVSLADMRTMWDRIDHPPIDWIAVDRWPALANSGDLIGLWDDAAKYSADQSVEEGSINQAVAGVVYGDSAPWPTGVDGDAIRLSNLGSDPADPAAWARARGSFADPDAWRAAEVFGPGGVVDNAGGDQGSPGFHWPNFYPPLPGDYNNDGAVDAADYTLWRDGGPLPTETATAGVTDAADYEVWRANYRGAGQGGAVGGAATVPEPATLSLFACLSLIGGRRVFRRVSR